MSSGTVIIIIGVVIIIIAVYLLKSGRKEAKEEEKEIEKAEPQEEIPKEEVKVEERRGEEEEKEKKEVIRAEELKEEEPKEEEGEKEEPKIKKEEKIEEKVVVKKIDKQELTLSLKEGLQKTRKGFVVRLLDLFKGKKEIDPQLAEEIEGILITSDVGVKTTEKLITLLKEELDRKELKDPDKVWDFIKRKAYEFVSIDSQEWNLYRAKPMVVLIVGVNGVGKTTTIGKLASYAKEEGKKVLMVAADTFRAAAIQQLEIWAKRVGVDIVKGSPGGDPGAVVFDAIKKAKEENYDIVFIDSAGRLHTKVPLMEELKKLKKVIGKHVDSNATEIWLVIDANTGQNAIQQAHQFHEALELTGLIITKLDGTAKGGVVIGICDELKIPVRYIGIGERMEDLKIFDPESFIEALFSREEVEAKVA